MKQLWLFLLFALPLAAQITVLLGNIDVPRPQ